MRCVVLVNDVNAMLLFFTPKKKTETRILLNLASTSEGITLNDWTSNRNNRFLGEIHLKNTKSFYHYFVQRINLGIFERILFCKF